MADRGNSGSHEVLITAGTEQDLESIHSYVSQYHGVDRAEYVLGRLMNAVSTLATFPERGSFPKELSALGIKEYRQLPFKPFRLIYRVIDQRVVIYVIADTRREFQSLLLRRLLGA